MSVPLPCPDLEQRLWKLARPSPAGSRPTLSRIQALLALLGHPERELSTVLIGGTSGKGSTCHLLGAILRAAGYQPGMHTKPHLHTVRERFQIGEELISCSELGALLQCVSVVLEQEWTLAASPTWFEVVVALVFLWLKEHRARPNIVEVGLGGTWDATNALWPLISVITTVGLDHTEILGSTVERIATDKAGVIKPGTLVISGASQPSVRAILQARADIAGTELWLLGREIRVADHQVAASGSTFDLEGRNWQFRSLRVGALGRHQVHNAALAVSAAMALQRFGYHISEEAVRNGLTGCTIPGRMELIEGVPPVLLDGAHNPEKMAALATAVEELFPGRRTVWVIAMRRGHDAAATLAALRGLAHAVVCTRFGAVTDWGMEASQPPDSLLEIVAGWGISALVLVDVPEALQRARMLVGERGLVVVTGSLYLVGEVRALLRRP